MVEEVLIGVKEEVVGAHLGAKILDSVHSLQKKVFKEEASIKDVREAGKMLLEVRK